MKRLKKLFSKAYDKVKRKQKEEPYIKLEDMEVISQVNIDYSYIVYNIVGYKDRWIDKILFRQDKKLKQAYKKALKLVKELKGIQTKDISLSNDLKIKTPNQVDFISFRAMMELQAVINQGIVTTLSDLMAHTIAIVCYKEHYEGDYDSDLETWKTFKDSLLKQPLVDMLAIYKWIEKDVKESQQVWNHRFNSVDVLDEDYEKVGGSSMMAPFNVVNTVKNLCSDFNIPYEKAWQMSYAISQTNSYAKATYNYIQDEMRKIKESKMRQERNRKRV